MVAAQDQVRRLLADHRRRRLGVAADQARHDRGVGDTQVLHRADPQLRIEHRVRIAAHAAGADRMILRVGMGPDQSTQRVLVVGAAAVHQPPAQRAQRRRVVDPLADPRARQHGLHVARVGQEVRIDHRRIAHVGAGQPNRAAAVRTQHADLQRVARPPMQLAVMLVDDAGAEMKLQVRPVQRRIAFQESARLGDVGGQQAALALAPGQHLRRHPGDHRQIDAEQPVGPDRDLGAVVDVVLQVGADLGAVADQGDAMLAQMRRRADAGRHQQLRGAERAGCQDHLEPGIERQLAVALAIDHADRPRALEADPPDLGVGDHPYVARPRGRRPDIGGAGIEPLARLLEHLVAPDPFLLGTVEVGIGLVAGLQGGLDEGVGGRIALAQILDAQRAAGAMQIRGAAAVALGALEIGQHVAPAPAVAAERLPVAVILCLAANIDHRVDQARSADAAAARLVALAAAEPRLRHGLVGVVVPVPERHQTGDAERRPRQQAGLLRAGLEQGDGQIRTRLGETRRHGAPARTGADDDVIGLFGHRFPPWSFDLGNRLARVQDSGKADLHAAPVTLRCGRSWPAPGRCTDRSCRPVGRRTDRAGWRAPTGRRRRPGWPGPAPPGAAVPSAAGRPPP